MISGAFRRWFFIVFLSLSVVLLLSACANTVKVKGRSMEPTISDGETLSIDPAAFKTAEPQRGDVVIHESEGVKYIRRIVGLPGEKITIDNGAVYIDGSKLDEPYLAPGTRTESDTKEFSVPVGSYFVLGDNRAASRDSRTIGFIQRDRISAKVLR